MVEADNSNWILIRCELCGVTSKTMNDWSGIRCPLHGNPVCGHCCAKCQYKEKFSGLYRCGYKTPEQRRMEAHKKARERFEAENRRVSAAVRAVWKEKAKEKAIKKAQADRRANMKNRRSVRGVEQ